LVEPVGGNPPLPIQVVLFDEGEHSSDPTPPRGVGAAAAGPLQVRAAVVRVAEVDFAAVARQRAERVVVVMAGPAELLEVVGALDASGSLADLLHRGQQQANEDGDDGDYDQ